MQGAESSPSQSQPVVVETSDTTPAPLPAITVRVAEGVVPVTQTEVRNFFCRFSDFCCLHLPPEHSRPHT